MLDPDLFYDALRGRGLALFAGVPDSLLAGLCACLERRCARGEHVTAANEGNAVALAAGHYLATGRPALVYMQNSGLGNAVNPLTSLADAAVYRLPMLLLVGWRGEPGVPDEPQHVTQGRITPGLLDLLGVPWRLLEAASDPAAVLDWALERLEATGAPVALLVRKGTFAKGPRPDRPAGTASLGREAALARLLELADPRDLLVATTGKTSRELFELRLARGETPRDLLTVGGMGHTASLALGVALGRPGRRVVCLDGDGSILMHLGALPVIADLAPANFVHVLLNNGVHDSVGGKPTVAGRVDFQVLARAAGYRRAALAADAAGLSAAWHEAVAGPGPALLEIRLRPGARADLGRPTTGPGENKRAFMAHAAG